MAFLKNTGFPEAGLKRGAASTSQMHKPDPHPGSSHERPANQAEGFTVGSGRRLRH